MPEWRKSAAAGLLSFGNLGSAGLRTAAAVCAAEPEDEPESGCKLKERV